MLLLTHLSQEFFYWFSLKIFLQLENLIQFFSHWFLTIIQWVFFSATIMLCTTQRDLHDYFWSRSEVLLYQSWDEEANKRKFSCYLATLLHKPYFCFKIFQKVLHLDILNYSIEKVQHHTRRKYVLLVVVVIYMFLGKDLFFAIFTE